MQNDQDNSHNEPDLDELPDEFETAQLSVLLKDGVRGKYVERYREGTSIVKVAPDVARVLPNKQAAKQTRLAPD